MSIPDVPSVKVAPVVAAIVIAPPGLVMLIPCQLKLPPSAAVVLAEVTVLFH